MSATATEAVDRETLANEFRQSMEGKLDAEKVDATVAALKATTTAYPAHGSVASMIVYLKWGVTINGGESFEGDSGGLSTPGGGALFGDVYTDNLARLYSDTRSFWFIAASAYTTLIFYDNNHTALGSFQAGGLSTVAGTGGGTGRWS